MRVLVACEESQRVTKEFRKRGHEAYSCDIENSSGGQPNWHIKSDVSKLINGRCKFITEDGTEHKIEGRWDLLIAHPPCTYLTTCCNRAYSVKHNPLEKIIERYKKRDEAIKFFMQFINADCEKIAVENPQGYMNTHYRKPDCTVHPYYFVKSIEDEENYNLKKTCFWLKGLPNLEKENDFKKPPAKYISKGVKTRGRRVNWVDGMSGVKDRAKERSKTFPAMARAMAEKWG